MSVGFACNRMNEMLANKASTCAYKEDAEAHCAYPLQSQFRSNLLQNNLLDSTKGKVLDISMYLFNNMVTIPLA